MIGRWGADVDDCEVENYINEASNRQLKKATEQKKAGEEEGLSDQAIFEIVQHNMYIGMSWRQSWLQSNFSPSS